MAEKNIVSPPISCGEGKNKDYHDIVTKQLILESIIKDNDLVALISLLNECSDCESLLNREFFDEDYDSVTPLHFAVKNSNVKICKVLIDQGSDINALSSSEFGYAPMHLAIDKNVAPEILNALITKGANIEIEDEIQCTPLQLLFMEPGPEHQFQFEKFKMLLDCGANVNTRAGYGAQPLHGSVKIFHSGVCEEIHDSTDIPLCVKVTQMLIDKGANVNCVPDFLNTPLHFAVPCDLVTELLLKYNANVNHRNVHGLTPLLNIAKYTTPILNENAYANGERYLKKRVKSLELLLSFNADINSTTYMGENALHFLLSNPSVLTCRMLEMFLKFGANVNAKSTRLETPMHYLCLQEKSEIHEGAPTHVTLNVLKDIMKVLKENNVDLEAKNINGYSPVVLAFLRGNRNVIKILLKEGVNTNPVDRLGRSLHQLLEIEDIADSTKLLLHHPSADDCGERTIVLDPTSDNKHNDSDQIEKNGGMDELADLLSLLEPINSDVDVTSHVKMLKDRWSNIDQFCEKKITEINVGKLSVSESLEIIQKEIDTLIHRIAHAVKNEDPRMAFTAKLSGSMSEGTKIGNMDEFDYLLYMDVISEMCDISEADFIIPGFVHISAKENTSNKDRMNIFREKDNLLIANSFGSYLYQLIQRVLGTPGIWQCLNFYWEKGPLTPLHGASSISNLELKWAGTKRNGLLISIDLAPVIHLKSWKPKKMKQNCPFLGIPTDAFGSLVVVSKQTTDKNTFRAGNETYLRLSYSHIEKELFLSFPDNVRTSYILAKILLSDNLLPLLKPNEGSVRISSYMLKMALFTVIEREIETMDISGHNESQSMKDIRKRTSNMFKYIAQCIENENLPSYFLPQQNILQYHRMTLNDRIISLVISNLLE